MHDSEDELATRAYPLVRRLTTFSTASFCSSCLSIPGDPLDSSENILEKVVFKLFSAFLQHLFAVIPVSFKTIQ